MDWPNMFAKTRFRYIEILFHTFHCEWGRKYRSLYRGSRILICVYLQNWCGHYSERAISFATKFDDHSPKPWRYAVLTNFFSNMFKCRQQVQPPLLVPHPHPKHHTDDLYQLQCWRNCSSRRNVSPGLLSYCFKFVCERVAAGKTQMLLNCNKEDCNSLDCEQSLFFFRFSKRSARARALSGSPRDARNEGGSPRRKNLSCLSRLAPSVTRVVICVSRAICSTDEEKRETARRILIHE